MKPIALLFVLCAAAPASAAVSGFYDSAEQITTILGSSTVADNVRQMPIKELSFDGRTRDGLIKWEIETRHCDIDVFLREVQSAGVGKTRYEVARVHACD